MPSPSFSDVSVSNVPSALSREERMGSFDRVAILDCGAQYTKVIDRRIRELRVATDIFPLSVPAETLRKGFSGIILSGGPYSVYDQAAPAYDPEIFNLNLPILGICYGMQLLNQHCGGEVTGVGKKEYGETEISVDQTALLFKDLESIQPVLMSHGDSVTRLAPGFVSIARSGQTIAALMHQSQKLYGVQFHPEVDLTENGQAMLRNFLYEICGLTGNYGMEDRLTLTLESIRTQVGDQRVFVLVSGGVDSTVTAALLLKALGPEKVFAVHIDSGLMRHQESDLVCEALKALGLAYLKRIDAASRFLETPIVIDGTLAGPLSTVTDPEMKRRMIGDVFYRLICESIEETGLLEEEEGMRGTFIAQGTLRPDLIESGNPDISQSAQKIKTHHNDVPLIQAQREKGLIVEPNRDWHKDEVRQVGSLLGLPEALVQRQPFPGPGLGVRILCTEKPFLSQDFYVDNERLQRMTTAYGLSSLLLPVQSVGVQGDGRSYKHLAVLSGDFESTGWSQVKELAQNIPNQIHSINRVAWIVNRTSLPKILKTVTPTFLNAKTIGLLRELDHEVTQGFLQANLLSPISQLLTVLVPVDTTGQEKYSLAIRAVITSDYMTVRPANLTTEIPWAFLRDLGQRLSGHPEIDWVMYDVTSKPPATVEWE